MPLHDRNLRGIALQINRSRIVKNFDASESWLNRLNRFAGLTSRRMTQFYQQHASMDQDRVKQAAQQFVAEIRHEMSTRPADCFVNVDQSGFAKEMTVTQITSLPYL